MATLTTTFSFIPNCSSSRSFYLKASLFSNSRFSAERPLVRRVGDINSKELTSINMTTKMVTSSGFCHNGASATASSSGSGSSSSSSGGGGSSDGGGGAGAGNDEGVGTLEREGFVNRLSHFIANDLQSFINELSKWLVCGLFIALVLWRREAEFFWATMGSMLNACLSYGLKKILNQERPFSTLRSDPGMPSSHAQTIFYIVVFLIISLVKSQGVNAFTFVVGGLILASGSYLAWLRVTHRLHSLSQVIVGAIAGSAFSMLWFWSWGAFALKAYISFSWVRILISLSAVGHNLIYINYLFQSWNRNSKSKIGSKLEY